MISSPGPWCSFRRSRGYCGSGRKCVVFYQFLQKYIAELQNSWHSPKIRGRSIYKCLQAPALSFNLWPCIFLVLPSWLMRGVTSGIKRLSWHICCERSGSAAGSWDGLPALRAGLEPARPRVAHKGTCGLGMVSKEKETASLCLVSEVLLFSIIAGRRFWEVKHMFVFTLVQIEKSHEIIHIFPKAKFFLLCNK